MAGPRQYVSAPSFTQLPHGLLSTLAGVIRTPSDDHWKGGVTYETLCGAGGSTYDECLVVSGTGSGEVVEPAEPPAKSATASLLTRGATPFTVFAEVDCSTPGFWDRAERSVRDALAQSEEYQVERAFWTGVAGGGGVVYPHLAADTEYEDAYGALLQTAVSNIGEAAELDVVEALGRVEGELAECYNGVGVIHIPRTLAPAFAAENLIIPSGPGYVTHNGNIVVFGAGYTGSFPDGSTNPNAMFIYATGAMFIYRSDVRVFTRRESLDRGTNTLKMIAERTYVVGWDCCHIGVKVTLGGVGSGSAGDAAEYVV